MLTPNNSRITHYIPSQNSRLRRRSSTHNIRNRSVRWSRRDIDTSRQLIKHTVDRLVDQGRTGGARGGEVLRVCFCEGGTVGDGAVVGVGALGDGGGEDGVVPAVEEVAVEAVA